MKKERKTYKTYTEWYKYENRKFSAVLWKLMEKQLI